MTIYEFNAIITVVMFVAVAVYLWKWWRELKEEKR